MCCKWSKPFDPEKEYNPTGGHELLEHLKGAEVIFGADKERDGLLCLVYGRELLKRSVAAGAHAEAEGVVMRVDVRRSTEDLEVLQALVETAKGHWDYLSTDDSADIEELERMMTITDGSNRSGGGKK